MFKYASQVLKVHLWHGGCDEKFIHICVTEVESTKNVVDKPLEGLGRVPYFKWDSCKFIATMMAVLCHLVALESGGTHAPKLW